MYYLFKDQCKSFRELLLTAPEVDVGQWHSMDVSGKPELVTKEMHVFFHTYIPETVEEAQQAFEPNLPWAEDQFLERVSGEPHNPGETYKRWPWQSKMEEHVKRTFSHTYMERYWPKKAHRTGQGARRLTVREGIRFNYGDLNDLVDLLARSPFTRQAILPVWFPEDTGAVHRGRVPCSLTYQFLLRDGRLNCVYNIRSCDYVRHFRDDVYMTARLTQWVLEQAKGKTLSAGMNKTKTQEYSTHDLVWKNVRPGNLTFHCPSLHIMKGDIPKLERERNDASRFPTDPKR